MNKFIQITIQNFLEILFEKKSFIYEILSFNINELLVNSTVSDYKLKLQPAIFPLFKHVIRFHELPARQAFIVDWSLSGIMTLQIIIRESELT